MRIVAARLFGLPGFTVNCSQKLTPQRSPRLMIRLGRQVRLFYSLLLEASCRNALRLRVYHCVRPADLIVAAVLRTCSTARSGHLFLGVKLKHPFLLVQVLACFAGKIFDLKDKAAILPAAHAGGPEARFGITK